MISAYGDTVTITAALERGGGKFLMRPVDIPELKSKIAAAIAKAQGTP